MIASGCFACENNARFDALPVRERICADAHWRAAHAVGTSLPGWLVLLPRRHVTAVAELSDAEAAELGLWQIRLSRALHTVTGCLKTYVVQFAEAEGHSHVHFHVVPRMSDWPEDRRGAGVFGFLGQSDDRAVSPERMEAVASALTRHLQADGARGA